MAVFLCIEIGHGSPILHSVEMLQLHRHVLVVLSFFIFCLALLYVFKVIGHEFKLDEFIGGKLLILNEVLSLIVCVIRPRRELFARRISDSHVLFESSGPRWRASSLLLTPAFSWFMAMER